MPTAAAALARDCRLQPNDLVLEFGAGNGVLTAAIAATGARVIAVEVDVALAARARRRVDNGRTDRQPHVRTGDLFDLRLPQSPYRVVANIPFARTTAILGHLFDRPDRAPWRADLIVQWGAGVGLTAARPARPDAVAWQASFSFSLGRRIPAGAFTPAPSVDAVVLRVERRATPLVAPRDASRYRTFVAATWAAPSIRIGVRGALSERQLTRAAAAHSFDRHDCPTSLTPVQWAALFDLARRR